MTSGTSPYGLPVEGGSGDALGLDPVEVALLRAIDLLGADDQGEPVACDRVLRVLEQRGQAGAAAAYPALVRRGVPWSVHLPLVELLGNAGSRDDPPAGAEHVEVRLSPVGALVLSALDGGIDPVPLGLVEGTAFRGGEQPPFDPAAVVSALLAGGRDAGRPAFPTGGVVGGALESLLQGEPARVTVSSAIRAEGGHLAITEIPYGVGPRGLHDRVHDARAALRAARERCPMQRIVDETNVRDGVRLYVEPAKGPTCASSGTGCCGSRLWSAGSTAGSPPRWRSCSRRGTAATDRACGRWPIC